MTTRNIFVINCGIQVITTILHNKTDPCFRCSTRLTSTFDPVTSSHGRMASVRCLRVECLTLRACSIMGYWQIHVGTKAGSCPGSICSKLGKCVERRFHKTRGDKGLRCTERNVFRTNFEVDFLVLPNVEGNV